MAGTTTKGLLPYPTSSDNNDTPADMLALATRLDAILGVEALTTVARDALAAAQKWDGRVIFNSTLRVHQSWDNTNSVWIPVRVYNFFASAAARDAAITAPVEGQIAYLQDTDAIWLYDGAVWRLRWRWGTGSPETVVTATVGAQFIRTDGAAGTVLYVKESGTGNTGWTALGAPPVIAGDSDQIVLGVEVFS